MMTGAERVKRHRESRKFIRVEVEVPTAADALAVRRFAQRRRNTPTTILADQVQTKPDDFTWPSLDGLATEFTPEAGRALRLFAAGLAMARSPALTARGLRIATNFRDVAQSHAQTAGLE